MYGEEANQNGTSHSACETPNYFNLKEMEHILKNLDIKEKVHPNILDAIGNTPLVKLTKIPHSENIECDMYAKCEFMNPGGSVKDRIAFRMVLDAEKKGILIPGKSVIIEPTSGNTGIGLALAAAVKGYRCIIVLPEKMSDEKVNILVALGAEIVRTPTEAAWDSPDSNIMVARRMATEIDNAVVLDQYNNPCNPLAHYDSTAEEILWALDGRVDMVVVGAGTSGTISGVGHKIKERCPDCVVVGVDPYGSILAQPEELNKSDVQFYEVEGIGYDFLPRALDRSVVDKWVKTEDGPSLRMARRLIREEGLLCGGSSGSAMCGALAAAAAAALGRGRRCVVLLPDGVRNYMTKFVRDPWMEARHFAPLADNRRLWWWEKRVPREVVGAAQSVSRSSSALEALKRLRQSGAPALLVLDDHGQVAGTVTADDVRRRLTNKSGSTAESIEKFMQKKYYKVDLAECDTLGQVSRYLDLASCVVVVESDLVLRVMRPVGIITSEDLLMYTINNQVNGNN